MPAALLGGRLEDLAARLRREDIPAGAAELIDASRLLKRLAGERPETADPARLRTLLRPVFCKSRAHQETFDTVFGHWLADWPREVPRPTPTPAPERSREPAPLLRRPGVFIPLALVAAILLALLISPKPPAEPPRPAAESAAAPRAAAPQGPAEGAGPAAPAVDSIAAEDFTGYMPAVRYRWQVDATWMWWLLLAPLALFFGFHVPARMLAAGRARTGGKVRLQGWDRERARDKLVSPLAEDTGGRLLRHQRGPASEIRRLERRPLLDLRRTVDATLRNLGVPALRYRDARLRPSYLVLVEAEDDDDLLVRWAERLAHEDLEVDLRRLAIRDGEVRALPLGAARDAPGLPLAALPAPHYGQRLVVVSDGEWLADAGGAWRPAARRAGLRRWRERVLFTGRQPRRWGPREAAIERPLGAGDPGFLVLPRDESALSAWTRFLVTGLLPEISLAEPQRFPGLIDELGEDALIADASPDPAVIGRLIGQLRLYLGPNGFYWLCCCAVPPLVHPQLALLLGETFLFRSGAVEEDVGRYVARNYALLHRLPWLRRRRLPEWLRVALLGCLPAPVQAEVRDAVAELMRKQRPEAGGNLELDLEPPPGPQAAGGVAATGTGDALYLGFMAGEAPDRLALRMPDEWSRWLQAVRPAPPWRQRVAARLAAWRDRLMFRDGLSHLGPRPLGLGIAAALALVLSALLIAAAWVSPTSWPGRVRESLFAEHANAIGFRHEATVTHAAFSSDGRRVVTASHDLTARVWEAATGRPVGKPLRHESFVRYAAFSPDGRRVVTASQDKTARIWEVAGGEPVGEPLRHGSGVNHAEFSPDGRWVVTASQDKTARVWDAASGRPVGEPLGHGDSVSHAAFSPDGRWVVTASRDRTARVWAAATGQPAAGPLPHADSVVQAAFSPDGRWLVTASGDHTARVWETATGRPVGKPLQHAAVVNHGAFSPDGRWIVTASGDATARVWEAATGRPVGEPLRHQGPVYHAAFGPDGRWVVTSSHDGTARIWEAASGKPVGEPLRHERAANDAAFSRDGRWVVTASDDNTARIWEAASGRPLGESLRHEGGVNHAAFSPDSLRVATASADKTARVWDAATGRAMGEALRHGGSVTHIAFSPDGRRVVTASADQTARVWDAGSGEALGEPMRHADRVNHAAFSPDGRRVVTASDDRTARLWDAESGRPVGDPLRHAGPVEQAAFAPDGRRVVTASRDNTARVWDAASGRPAGEPLRHDGWVNHAAFSPDGLRVATAGNDNTARIWEAASGRPVGEPMRHGNWVTRCVFSPDGRRLATASQDRTARFWDAATGRPAGAPLRHADWVNHAAFSADGRWLVTASQDGTARFWDVATGRPAGELLRHDAPVTLATFGADGHRVVTATARTASAGRRSPESRKAIESVIVPKNPVSPVPPARDKGATTGDPSRWVSLISAAEAAQLPKAAEAPNRESGQDGAVGKARWGYVAPADAAQVWRTPEDQGPPLPRFSISWATAAVDLALVAWALTAIATLLRLPVFALHLRRLRRREPEEQ